MRSPEDLISFSFDVNEIYSVQGDFENMTVSYFAKSILKALAKANIYVKKLLFMHDKNGFSVHVVGVFQTETYTEQEAMLDLDESLGELSKNLQNV